MKYKVFRNKYSNYLDMTENLLEKFIGVDVHDTEIISRRWWQFLHHIFSI